MQYNVESALQGLGINYEDHGNEALALCPMHEERTGKADHSPSWWINLETGMHVCFSCGYKGNLIQLVCDLKNFVVDLWGKERSYDYKAGEGWLATVAEISLEQLASMVNSLPTYIAAYPKPVAMSEARLAVFVDPPEDALQSRSITADAAKAYGVMWNQNTKTWILPLREPHFNKLIGWQEKGTVERTFMNRPPGLPRSKTLFGLENQNESMVIVVESPLDCVRIASAGWAGAVAVCGSTVSEEQVKLLRYSDKVVAAFDNPNVDKSGAKASKEMLNWSRKYGINLYFFNYGDSGKKDPGDLTDEEIRYGIENAVSSIYGESAYVQGNPQALSS